jgi:hypothetical protein
MAPFIKALVPNIIGIIESIKEAQGKFFAVIGGCKGSMTLQQNDNISTHNKRIMGVCTMYAHMNK